MADAAQLGLILVDDGEGRTGDAAGISERVQKSAAKCRFSCAQIAGESDHSTGGQPARQLSARLLGLCDVVC